MLALANTTGKQNLVLSLKHMIVDNQPRTVTWSIQYSTVASANEWITVATFSRGRWGVQEASYPLGAALNNISGPVFIRIAALSTSTGSGSRDTYAIDDVTLTWEEGSAVTLAPTVQAANLRFDGTLGTSTRVTFRKGNGAQRLVLARYDNPVAFAPVNDVTYTASSVFGASDSLDTGKNTFAVYRGPDTTFVLTGLAPERTVHLAVFEFNGGPGDQKYLTAAPAAASVTTGKPAFATDFESGTLGDWVTLSAASNRNWNVVTSAGNGAGASARFAEANGFGGDAASDDWLISPLLPVSGVVNPMLRFSLASAFVDNIPGLTVYMQAVSTGGSRPVADPAQWTQLPAALPSADNVWEVRNVPVDNLPANGFFRIAFRYQSSGTGSSAAKRIRIDDISLESQGEILRPTTGASAFSIINTTSTSGEISFTPGNGAGRLVIFREGGAPTQLPKDGVFYRGSSQFGGGDTVGTGNFAVSAGPDARLVITGLKPETTYGFLVYEFNGTGSAVKYLTDVAFNGSSLTTAKASSGTGGALDLFFTEYVEGFSNNKALEIFNGTGVEVDLSSYRVSGKNNGTDAITVLTWPAGTKLAPNAIRLLIDGAASDTMKALVRAGQDDLLPVIPQNSSIRYATSFNGNDFRVLEKNNGGTWTVIDRIGDESNPAPVVAWDVAGVGAATVNRTLVRKPFVNKGSTDWAAAAGTSPENGEWEVRAFNSIADLGKHTFNPGALVDPFDFAGLPTGLTTISLTWRLNGAGHGVLLVMSEDNAFSAPVNGTAYTAGQSIGGDAVLAVGSITSAAAENLASGRSYFFKIYSVNAENNYSAGRMIEVPTAKPEPSAHVSNFALTSFTGASLAFAWTDDNGTVKADAYVVMLSKNGAASITPPVDGVELAEGPLVKRVNRGVQAVTFTFLENNITYSAKIFPYTNRGALVNFKTDGTVPAAQGTTSGTSLFENIGGTLKGAELITQLRADYRVTRSLGYDNAREKMYSNIDLSTLDSLSCVYTGYSIKINRSGGGRSQAAAGSINAEHTWPQSLGAENEPMRSDMHHLFPSWENANSARSNHPFAEIPDNQVSTWWGRGTVGGRISAPPLEIRDLFSELADAGSNSVFEPREDHKGNVARAIFYFWTLYQHDALTASNQRFFEGMKQTLYRWHYQDPPNEREIKRSTDVAREQGNRNPFVHDTTLIRRAYFPHIGGTPVNNYTVNTPALNFGTRRVGKPAQLIAFVQNLSATTALELTSIRVDGTGAAAFVPGVAVLSIPAGATGEIPVTATAGSLNLAEAALRFNASFGTPAASIPLSVRGGAFAMAVRPGSLIFDLEAQQDDVKPFSLVNTGETIARVNRMDVSARISQIGSVFAPDLTFPFDILPGDSVTFDLQLDLSAMSTTGRDTVRFVVDGEPLPSRLLVWAQMGATSNEDNVRVSAFQLHQNHPNPFNPSTTIRFDLPEAAPVRLEIFNLAGQRVASLADRAFAAGTHAVTFDATGLASGLYVYRITAGRYSAIRKMMLVK